MSTRRGMPLSPDQGTLGERLDEIDGSGTDDAPCPLCGYRLPDGDCYGCANCHGEGLT